MLSLVAQKARFPPETGPKLARKENRLHEISHKRLIIFAPQPGLEPMRALKNDPVDHFSEAVRLQGGLKSLQKTKSRSMTGFLLPS
jgi:hypothetical protein